MKVTVKYPRLFGAKETRELTFHVDWDKPQVALEQIYAGFNAGSGEESPVFLNGKMRSMSVGDFVEIEGQWYQCADAGWRKVTESKVNEVMALPYYDTWKDRQWAHRKTQQKENQ